MRERRNHSVVQRLVGASLVLVSLWTLEHWRATSDVLASWYAHHPYLRTWTWLTALAVALAATAVLQATLSRRLSNRVSQLKREDGQPSPLVPVVPEELIEAVRAGECVLYAGAGVGAQAGLPTWSELIPRLLEWAAKEGLVEEQSAEYLRAACHEGQYDSVADAIAVKVRPEQLTRKLTELFLRSSAAEVHRLLHQLTFSAVLTTNFDDLLERRYEASLVRRIEERFSSDRTPSVPVYTHEDTEPLLSALSTSRFFILKLYGSLEHPRSVLLAPAQYESKIARNRQFAQFIEGLFFSRTLLFVGASLDGIDAYLRGIQLPAETGRRHYALVAVKGEAWRAKAEFVARRYDIQVIPYTPSDDYPELNRFLGELISRSKGPKRPKSRPTDGVADSSITKVVLTNVGPFEQLTLDLEPGWNVFLGDNGMGKSTILKAIAIAICGEDAQPFADRIIRDGQPQAQITLTTKRGSYRTTINRRSGLPELTVVPQRPLEAEGRVSIGYGALRYGSWDRPKGPRTDSRDRPMPADLLPLIHGGPDPRLDSLKQWLVNLDYQISRSPANSPASDRAHRLRERLFSVFNELADGLNVALDSIDPKTFQIKVRANGDRLPIEALSQGTSSLLGWIGYLLERLSDLAPPDTDPTRCTALVLIDEIDAHMHPGWQRTLVPHLRKLFPAVQFVATTHSPLIVGGMEPGELYSCRRDEFGTVMVERSMARVRGLFPEQILTGPNFGLSSSVDPETERYRELFARRVIGAKLTEAESEELDGLAKRAPAKLQIGETEAQQIAFRELMEAMRVRVKKLDPSLGQSVLKEAALMLTDASPNRTGAKTSPKGK